MQDWGKKFIEQYTDEEKESLEQLIAVIFLENMKIGLGEDLLNEISRTWWMVLGSFGNTALFDIIASKSDDDFVQDICADAGIRYDVYNDAIDGLVTNNVADLAEKEEDVEKFTYFLMFDMISIFIHITNASESELVFANNPDPELIKNFYIKSSYIMNKGSNTWRELFKEQWNDMLLHPEK